MDLDNTLEKLGGFGNYQCFLFMLLFFTIVPMAFNNVGIVFIAAVPKHWCDVPQLRHLNVTDDVIKNLTIPQTEKDGVPAYSSCIMYDRNYSGWTRDDVWDTLSTQNGTATVTSCHDGWVYDTSVYTSSIVTEWDLVCERRWFQATASSVYMAGYMVGVLVFGIISDRIGRRPAFIISVSIKIVLDIVIAFSPNFLTFIILRFLIAGSSIAYYTCVFVLALEMSLPRHRVLMGLSAKYSWIAGYMLLAALAYGMRDWFVLQLSTAVPCVLMALSIFFLPESIRWMHTKGKHKEADKLMETMSRWNNVRKDVTFQLSPADKQDAKGQIWDLFRTPRMRLRTVVVCCIWVINSLVYYGLSLNSSKLGGNDFINFAISGAVELPASIITQFSMVRTSRRWTLFVSMILSGAALLCSLAVPTGMAWMTITIAMVGKMCICLSYLVIYFWTAELYPTVVRNVGVATGSFFSRIGGIAAPYIAQLADFGQYVPLVIFGALAVVGGVIGLILPETMGQKLPETLEDGENFGRKRKKRKDIYQPISQGKSDKMMKELDYVNDVDK